MEPDSFQQKASMVFNGPALILAGPGSGKTTVMIRRIVNLIVKYKVPPENILAVTFSRAAAREMLQRFQESFQSESSPAFGTFHSIFFHILKSSSVRSLKLISEKSRYDFIKNQLKDLKIEADDEAGLALDIAGYISRYKNSCGSEEAPYAFFESIRKEYESFITASGLIDFDDMILKSYQILLHDKVLLSKWQAKFRYILIDEFQDINELQYRAIRLIAGNEANIFAVGDDDQSIYRFRGAYPGIMQIFLDEFPDAFLLTLSRNYRSCQKILDVSEKIIRQNRERVKKTSLISAYGNNAGAEDSVIIKSFYFREDETDFISGQILRLIRNGITPENIAVLLRRNLDIPPIVHKLNNLSIPVYYSEKRDELTESPVFLDIMAYISLANDLSSDASKAALRIINKPQRYISPIALKASSGSRQDLIRDLKIFYRERPASLNSIKDFEKALDNIRGLPPYGAFQYILNATGYGKYIFESCLSAEALADKRQELNKLSELFKKNNNLQAIAEMKNKEMDTSGSKEGVRVMTMHASKGLEFDYVFLPSLNETIIPGRHTGKEELSEECRILYVAMTRAARQLTLTYSEIVRGKHDLPSRYIKNLLPG